MPTKKKRGVSKQASFLAAFAATASITKAAKAAKLERTLHYRWLREDEEYPAAFALAYAEAAQTLEDEAVRRANEGVLEPITYQGGYCYKRRLNKETGKLENYGAPLVIRKYSDGLMQTLLKAFKPEKYRERNSLEVTGAAGGPIVLENKALAKLSDEELASLIALAAKIETE